MFNLLCKAAGQLVVLAWATTLLAGEPAAAPLTLITQRDGKLYAGEEEFRFVSFNIPNLHLVEDEFDFLTGAQWRWPTEFEINDALATIQQLGGRVVRTHVLSVRRDDSDMGDTVHVTGPGQFNEAAFVALDQVLAAANRHGVRVIVPLVDNWRWWGGVEQYARFRDKPAEAFWTDAQLRTDFKQTVKFLLTRRNTITGVEYRHDPAIFGWETGNEISSPPEWTADIAAYLKQLDAQHVVIDGDSLRGVPEASLANSDIDVVTQHFYPNQGTNPAEVIRNAMVKIAGKKAYFVGEIGFLPTDQIRAAIDSVEKSGASGLLGWSLRYRRETGGFFWHSEPASQGTYKAYHWPGFASGERYDETNLLSLMQTRAFAIQGLPLPAPARHAAPQLLPIVDPAHISWRGSTGAKSYRLERAVGSQGPWTVIASGVTETDTQYRPLSGDFTAAPGAAYYYRVIAVSRGGESAPSNVVGPVTAVVRTLVDELADDLQATQVSGAHKWVFADARRTQEDAHRLQLNPGGSVSYEVGLPVRQVRLWAFATQPDEALTITATDDSGQTVEGKLERNPGPAAAGDYNYLTPMLVTCEFAGTARRVTLSRPEAPHAVQNNGELQLGRVELAAGSAELQEQISPTPVNPSILLLDESWLARAPELVARAAELGATQVNFVVTIHAQLNDDHTLREFGLMHTHPDYHFEPLNDELHAKIVSQWKAAFAAAHEAGLKIAILPHLDAAGPDGLWRNWIDFDPLQPTGGSSFYDLVLEPVAKLLVELDHDAEVDFSLGGEMGRSLFTYPESYRLALQRLRALLGTERWRFGVSLNHGGVTGKIEPTPQQLAGVQQFLDECDFLGFSNYRPVTPTPGVQEFVGHVDQFLDEVEELGLVLPPALPLEFSEIGLGGGFEGQTVTDPALACQTPWEGAWRPTDNPWRTPEMILLRRRYHRGLLEFLATQPARRRVTAAYFWSMGSWDPQGLASPERGDEELIAEFKEHNACWKGN